jgi:hypothetical protein
MKAERLSDIKKELSGRDVQELTAICIRLARYKKENKELIHYLLYDINDPLAYAEQVKSFLDEEFRGLSRHYYYGLKGLRKILRIMVRHIKFTGSKQVEMELLLWFCRNFMVYTDLKTTHKPLQTILSRQLEKIKKLMPTLHEDLQFDYRSELKDLLSTAEKEISWFNGDQYL